MESQNLLILSQQDGISINKNKVKSKRNVSEIDDILKAVGSGAVHQVKKKQSLQELLGINFATSTNVKTRDIVIFTQNFYLLKKAEFNNIHALSTVIETTENQYFKGVLQDILAGVEAGDYMYTTMEYYSNVFPYIYTNMIKVGELSGSLTKSLEQAVDYLDNSSDVSKKLRGIILPNAAMFVGLVALLFVGSMYSVPTIQNIYEEVGSEDSLPSYTIAFSNACQAIATHWYIPVAVVGILAAVVV